MRACGGQDGRDYCPVHELALPAPGAALKYLYYFGGVPLKGSFKGFLKGVYKGSIVGFHGIGALINTNAILEVPYYD